MFATGEPHRRLLEFANRIAMSDAELLFTVERDAAHGDVVTRPARSHPRRFSVERT
jgi:hypothetical protein